MSKHLFAILIGFIIVGIIAEYVQRYFLKKRTSIRITKAEIELRYFAEVVARTAKHDPHNGLLLAQLFERATTDLRQLLNRRECANSKQYPELYKSAQTIKVNIAALNVFFRDGQRNHAELPDFASTLYEAALSAEIRRTEELPLLSREHRKVLSDAKQLMKDFDINKNKLSAEELRTKAAEGLYHLVLLRNNFFFF